MSTLQRTLTLGPVVLLGLAYMTPIIVLGTFGIMADTTHGTTAGAYLLALVAMLLTARSYAVMAKEFPVAGSAYSYTRRAINAKTGFLVGWAVLLDYLFLPMVIWLFGAVYLNGAFPQVPMAAWILGFIVMTTGINIVGIRLATSVNFIMMLIQLSVLVAFVVLAVHYVLGDASKPLFSLAPLYQSQVPHGLLLAGAAIACYSFLGFDAVTTMTEETINPKQVIPRAIMLVTLLGGGIFVLTAYVVQLAHPGYQFASTDAAASEIARNIGGDLFVIVFLIGLVIGQFASGLSAQASASRLLYAMGRDGVLPRQWFGQLHPRFRTPVPAILLCGVVALLALVMDVTTSVSFINFGAFLAFSCVNLAVVAQFYLRCRQPSLGDRLRYLLLPGVGMLADLWLLVSLDHKALTLGLVWLGIGMLYLGYLTGGFRRNPPEMDFSEA